MKKPADTFAPTSPRDGGDFTDDRTGEQLSFLPPPPFAPSWPTPGTRDAIALNLFLAGRRLDHEDFFHVCGSWRLADAVLHLRDQGWPIEGVAIPAPTETLPGRVITVYRLPPKYIALAINQKAAA